ncbi:MAG TPA: type II secretion system F family protein [Solirubrobacterales bacterium]|jgi:type IV pilus assembly protein PilC|nr:type II secretion system F family protein [Solirubrobacterales bacterium]
MSTYAFRAVDVAGVPSRGEVDAETKAQVTEKLRERGLIVLDVSETSEAFKLESAFDRFRGIKTRDLSVFARQFSTLIQSGMPMLRSLYTLEDQTEDERLKGAIAGVRNDVEAGSSLADAMGRRPQIFDNLFRAMVRSGESSGRLDDALDRIAFQLEKLDALKREIRSAVMYPAFVFAAALVIMLAVVIFIVPIFANAFKEAVADQPGESASLPMLTQIMIDISNFLKGYWFIWLPAMVGLLIGFFQWKKTDRGREGWDRVKLRLPIHIGDIVRKAAVARWSRTFSGAVASGVPLLEAIKLTGQTSGNFQVEKAMEDVYASVQSGGTLAHPIEEAGVFPPMVGHMVSVGEESGQLEQMLTKVADFYEAEVDAKVKALTSLIEPAMIAIVGGMVGFIVIAMYLPLFSLYDKIR